MTAPRASRLGRPPATDGAATRARIMAAARSCFVTHGYDQTTMKDIANAASMTAGALYHHFSSKQTLFVEIYHQHQESVMAELAEPVPGVGHGFVDRLSAVLDKFIDMHADDPRLASFTAVAAIELQRHPELRALARADSGVVYRFVEELTANAPDIAEVDRQGVVNMLVAVFTGFSMFGAGTRRAAAHRSAIETFKRVLGGNLLS